MQLEKCVNNFTAYYNSQYSGRKINWLHHLSKGDVKTFYLKKRYEFQVTNYQMGVLLMFNKSDKFTVEEISSHTNLQDKELNRTLMVIPYTISKWAIRSLKDVCVGVCVFEANLTFACVHSLC